MRLAGHHAVVTGGGTGIGAAIARSLAADGTKLTLVGRRAEPLEAIASEIGAFEATADVTSRAEVDHAFAAARAAHGPITILVNNAGAAESVPFAKLDAAAWRRILAVNLDALFHCCQSALPDLRAADAGRIVTIASLAGLRGFGYTAHYVAAKHGAVGLMRALGAEYAGTALTANAVCPGFVDTAIVADAVANISARTGRSAAEARAALADLNPHGRMITPEEVAAAVLKLCLPQSGGITGQAIEIGGEAM